jgi:hypothetical protein
VKASLTKSRLHRSLGREGSARGRLVPKARMRRDVCALSASPRDKTLLQVHGNPLPFSMT